MHLRPSIRMQGAPVGQRLLLLLLLLLLRRHHVVVVMWLRHIQLYMDRSERPTDRSRVALDQFRVALEGEARVSCLENDKIRERALGLWLGEIMIVWSAFSTC